MIKQRGTGYSGLDSTRPTQQQESDVTNFGGTAPGGQTAFVGGNSQWSSSKGAQIANIPPGGQIDPVRASLSMHAGLEDEAPDGSRNVPIHPGLQPGLFRTASDANPRSSDGQVPVDSSSRGPYRN
jgi:hypothetical protein